MGSRPKRVEIEKEGAGVTRWREARVQFEAKVLLAYSREPGGCSG